MRGTVFDFIPLMIVLFVFGISMILASIILNGFIASATPEFTGQPLAILTNTQSLMGSFDYFFIFLAFGLIAAVIVGGYFIDVHPIFTIVSIFIIIILIVIVPQMANIFLDITASAELSAQTNQYPLTISFFQNLPIIILIGGIIATIVIFAKPRGGAIGGNY